MFKFVDSKQLLSALILTVIFSVTAAADTTAPEAKTPGKVIGATEVVIPEWFKDSFLDFREEVEEAAEVNKHVLIYFHISGCPYCQKMLDDNFRGDYNKSLIQASFDSIDLNLHGSREVAFNDETEVPESDLARALIVRYTPTILFMNENNQIVQRLNGYRSPREFRQVLNYVKDKAYLKGDFASYRQQHLTDAIYELKDHPVYQQTDNVQQLVASGKPVAILIEDKSCDDCERFHNEVFDLAETQALLKDYTVVRFDALDERPIIDDEGNQTTIRQWVNKLDISYRPAMLFYNEGKHRETLTGMLKLFHFQQLLSYVSGKHYKDFNTWSKYMVHRSEQLVKSGQNVDVWK